MGAPTFKECVAADIPAVFLNKMEFADDHIINGKKMTALVDDNELQERDKFKLAGAAAGGTGYKATRMVYVAKADFGHRPALGVIVNLDGRDYRVTQGTTEEAGILAIPQAANRT